MGKKFNASLMAVLLISAGGASAAEFATEETLRATDYGFTSPVEMQGYFDINDVEIQEVPVALSATQLEAAGVRLGGASADEGTIFDALTDVIVNFDDPKAWATLGNRFWKLINNNQPVVNVRTQTVTVVPQALAQNWMAMENWKGPYSRSYTVSAKNLYGITVISHTYTVAFNYGGQVKGQGAFLANATIIPSAVDVAWGFTLNSDVQVGQPINTGSAASPTPGVDLTVQWEMKSILKVIQGRDQFFVRGDGSSHHTTLR
ncbi:MAG TPA: hypothetical protein PLZ57_10555 [Pseudobdellovibrionaceae bacterium]|nr:hypothetical protein [Pseudobdellovibrionaceae bacterium]